MPTEADFFGEVPTVLTVSRLAQPLQDTPGAVTVLDREWIRRSGARTLAELLRLVPGYLVSGYNGANPVAAYHAPVDELGTRNLVLIDGRSVYSSTYLGGTLHGMYVLSLEEIERIEVLRGSNSAAFGANALFGVINVITRHPQDTMGGTVSLTAGEYGIRDVYVRHGWGDAQASHRLSVAQRHDHGYRFVNDDTRLNTVKWRSDWRLSAEHDLMLAAGYADSRTGDGVPADFDNPERDVQRRSAYLLARWVFQPSIDESWQGTFSWSEERATDRFIYQRPGLQGVVIDFGNQERRLHAEIQHQFRAGQHWRWVWGVGLNEDSALSPPLFFRDSRLAQRDWRLFVNAEWALAPDWVLNAGLFTGRHSHTGSYATPRFMINHHITPDHTVRFGLASAQRAPTLFEQFADVRYFRPDGSFLTRTFVSSGQVRPERLVSREISYLGRFPALNLVWDARLYDERFDREIDSFSLGGLQRDFINGQGFRTQGLEYQLRWQPMAGTHLLWNHNLNRFRWDDPAKVGQRTPPRQFWTLGWMQELPHDWSLALWAYGRDEMAWRRANSALDADYRIDLRIARALRWGTTRAEWSLTVQSLNGDRQEFLSSRPSTFPRRAFTPCMWSSEVPRLSRRRWLAWPLAGGLLLGGPAVGWGQPARVRVWAAERTGATGEVLEHLGRLWDGGQPWEVSTDSPTPLPAGEVRLHLTLGVRPLAELAVQVQRQPTAWSVPVLAALLPEAAYVAVGRSLPVGSSAIWLDQPPERFLALIQRVMPRRRRVGVLLGPASAPLEPALDRAAAERQLVLVKARVQEEAANLFPLLRNVLSESEVLLALPDPMIYNAATLQNILIATYRQRIPMVSYAESHVRAGATFSLHTTPLQVARQVAAAVQGWWAQGQLPAPARAASGAVAVNDQVARSLGLDVPDVEALQRALAGEIR